MLKKKFFRPLALTLIMLASFGVNGAIAQNIEAEEEAFDDAIEKFGYLSGNVFQCASEAESQAIEMQALNAFNGIARLFGTDRAFFYAAAYGVGATGKIDRSKCKELSRQFQDAMNSNALKKGE